MQPVKVRRGVGLYQCDGVTRLPHGTFGTREEVGAGMVDWVGGNAIFSIGRRYRRTSPSAKHA